MDRRKSGHWLALLLLSCEQAGPQPCHEKVTYHCYSKLQAALGPQVRGQIQFYLGTIPAGLPLPSLGSETKQNKQNKKHDSDFLSDSPAMVRDLH